MSEAAENSTDENTGSTGEKTGPLSKEEWIAAGKKEEDWLPPEMHALKGKMIKENQAFTQRALAEQQAEFDKRLEGIQDYYRSAQAEKVSQLEEKIESLKAEKDQQIKSLDADEAAKTERKIVKTEEALEKAKSAVEKEEKKPKAPPAPSPEDLEARDEFTEQHMPLIQQDDSGNFYPVDHPKARYFSQVIDELIPKQLPMAELTKAVEQRMVKVFGKDYMAEFAEQSNGRRQNAKTHEGGSKGKAVSADGLTMNDITKHERNFWVMNEDIYMKKADGDLEKAQQLFLKSVQEDRKSGFN